MKQGVCLLKNVKSFQNMLAHVAIECFFYRSVQYFHIGKYNLENDDISEALGERYRYKSEDKDHEYICQTCRKSLKSRKMPAQAVANQLEVPDVPEVLQNLTHLEVWCIALRIPFMSI